MSCLPTHGTLVGQYLVRQIPRLALQSSSKMSRMLWSRGSSGSLGSCSVACYCCGCACCCCSAPASFFSDSTSLSGSTGLEVSGSAVLGSSCCWCPICTSSCGLSSTSCSPFVTFGWLPPILATFGACSEDCSSSLILIVVVLLAASCHLRSRSYRSNRSWLSNCSTSCHTTANCLSTKDKKSSANSSLMVTTLSASIL